MHRQTFRFLVANALNYARTWGIETDFLLPGMDHTAGLIQAETHVKSSPVPFYSHKTNDSTTDRPMDLQQRKGPAKAVKSSRERTLVLHPYQVPTRHQATSTTPASPVTVATTSTNTEAEEEPVPSTSRGVTSAPTTTQEDKSKKSGSITTSAPSARPSAAPAAPAMPVRPQIPKVHDENLPVLHNFLFPKRTSPSSRCTQGIGSPC